MTRDPLSPPMRGSAQEQEALDRLLLQVRRGHSRALVLHGKPGIGKPCSRGPRRRHGRCGNRIRGRVLGTPADVRSAAEPSGSVVGGTASRSGDGTGPERRRVARLSAARTGRAGRLGLFAEAAVAEPLVCVVDDAQWIDGASAAVLAFVARRLDVESVAPVCAVSTSASALAPTNAGLRFGLPEPRMGGLCDDDARALPDSVPSGPVHPRVRDAIVAEARGYPLALWELPRGESDTRKG